MATIPDVNIGGSLLAVEWSLAGIVGIVLGLRLFTVICILKRVQAADYLMLLAFVRLAIPCFQSVTIITLIDLCCRSRDITHGILPLGVGSTLLLP